MSGDKAALKELEKINRRIDSISGSLKGSSSKAFFVYVLVVVVCLLCIAGLFYLSGEITGFVTFSESVAKTEAGGFYVDKPDTVRITTDLNSINAIMLSGKVYGEGKAAVFLVRPERKYLAYYFEGDAGGGVEFKDMCYDTCHVEGLGRENVLEFQLKGTTIGISNVTYLYSRVIDFTLEPLTTGIDYSKEKAAIIELKLTNNQRTEYTVLLYVDGPLSSSFSWQGSLIHLAPDEPEKTIPITIKLPSNLPRGTYTNKITARYVPPDTYDFVGESPVAESFVTVYNG
jgi:hypothetical protein